METFILRDDCRFFVGAYPCRYQRACLNCNDYQPIRRRVFIVMLGLLGDILIASGLPQKLKQQEAATHITWMVSIESSRPLELNPYVDRIIHYTWESIIQLQSEEYDLILNFERRPAVAATINRMRAGEKRGLLYGGPHNSLFAADGIGAFFFLLNTWNEFRTKINRKRWEEFYCELAGVARTHQYVLQVSGDAERWAESFVNNFNKNFKTLFVNFGSSFSAKRWNSSTYSELVRQISLQCNVILVGGEKERGIIENIHSEAGQGAFVYSLINEDGTLGMASNCREFAR